MILCGRRFVTSFVVLYPRSLQFHSTTKCYLNRFLFDPSEVVSNATTDGEEQPSRKVILPKEDYRTIHASKILGLHNGDTIRAGLVTEEVWTDSATIQWLPEGKVNKAEPLPKSGNPPGSLQIDLHNLQPSLDTTDDLRVSLLLALPRPLQLGRMLPMIAQLGVEHLILCGAQKVPKDYFGSHLFREPHSLQNKLIEGLCQAGDVRLPQVQLQKNLRRFLASSEFESLFPREDYVRVLAHPQRDDDNAATVSRITSLQFPPDRPKRILLAVGPEGGWEEPVELDRFHQHGFQQVTLGKRVLRSDVAVVSLLSLANEVCREE